MFPGAIQQPTSFEIQFSCFQAQPVQQYHRRLPSCEQHVCRLVLQAFSAFKAIDVGSSLWIRSCTSPQDVSRSVRFMQVALTILNFQWTYELFKKAMRPAKGPKDGKSHLL
jgi:hypothetical protein